MLRKKIALYIGRAIHVHAAIVQTYLPTLARNFDATQFFETGIVGQYKFKDLQPNEFMLGIPGPFLIWSLKSKKGPCGNIFQSISKVWVGTTAKEKPLFKGVSFFSTFMRKEMEDELDQEEKDKLEMIGKKWKAYSTMARKTMIHQAYIFLYRATLVSMLWKQAKGPQDHHSADFARLVRVAIQPISLRVTQTEED